MAGSSVDGDEESEPILVFEVTDDEAGLRLDAALARLGAGLALPGAALDRRRSGARRRRDRASGRPRARGRRCSKRRRPAPWTSLLDRRGDPARHALRGRRPDRDRQAAGHGGAPGAGTSQRHAGECAAPPLPAIRARTRDDRRRAAAGHRAPPRPGTSGVLVVAKQRRGARCAGRAVPRPQRSSGSTAPSCAACPGSSRAASSRRIGRHPQRPQAHVDPHDLGARGGDRLAGCSTLPAQRREPARGPTGDGAHPPDPRAPGVPGTARSWATRCTAADAGRRGPALGRTRRCTPRCWASRTRRRGERMRFEAPPPGGSRRPSRLAARARDPCRDRGRSGPMTGASAGRPSEGGIRHPLLTAIGVDHGFGLRDGTAQADVVSPRQVHGAVVARLRAGVAEPLEADAIVSSIPAIPVGIVTADCVPVLVAGAGGTVVAAIHAGWRGLAAGVVERGVAALQVALPAREPAAGRGRPAHRALLLRGGRAGRRAPTGALRRRVGWGPATGGRRPGRPLDARPRGAGGAGAATHGPLGGRPRRRSESVHGLPARALPLLPAGRRGRRPSRSPHRRARHPMARMKRSS